MSEKAPLFPDLRIWLTQRTEYLRILEASAKTARFFLPWTERQLDINAVV